MLPVTGVDLYKVLVVASREFTMYKDTKIFYEGQNVGRGI